MVRNTESSHEGSSNCSKLEKLTNYLCGIVKCSKELVVTQLRELRNRVDELTGAEEAYSEVLVEDQEDPLKLSKGGELDQEYELKDRKRKKGFNLEDISEKKLAKLKLKNAQKWR